MAAPWDESAIDRRLALAVSRACETPLAEAGPPATSAAYLLYYRGDLALYRPVARSQTPIYVGSAKNLRRRLGEHRASIRSVRSLGMADFTVRVVETPTHGAAAYAESRLITLHRPVWNREKFAGFGSKHQGLGRIAAQAPSPWDSLHPGRTWARPPDRKRRRSLLREVEGALAAYQETPRPT